ncbi:DUF2752 domain-containing protein [Nocardioides sp. YIM 152315]|uniref:DUF2752 domain-containing protein n=1 Tax=Nocardioides sp. YIM 152315 TaxID=3031760 RepID=UPI0023DA83E8|nr:DUF2752 domain-containing protein [Nocardioides sp. YIM 152315]MDF1603106.1 DUF2752 domain-containing protein [Nocardioides sp. YIM 152315]
MTATAPASSPAGAAYAAGRWRRVRGPAVMLGGLGLATLALHLRDPHEPGSWGYCPSAALGVYCPGCGGLRAVNDLTHGQVGAAASSNLAFLVVVPFVVAGLGWWVVSRWRGTPVVLPARAVAPAAYAGLALLVAFTVLRNLAVGDWLAP